MGTSVPRIDFPSIAAGTHQYIQNFDLPGMVYGRIVRPPTQGATLVRVNGFKHKVSGGVKIVRKGDWLGVVAKTDWEAVLAARSLDATWSDWSGLPPEGDLYKTMRTLPLYDAAANPQDLRIGAQYKNPNPNVWQNVGQRRRGDRAPRPRTSRSPTRRRSSRTDRSGRRLRRPCGKATG